MKIEHIEVYGWRAAIRGMRNPMNSWNRSDSQFWPSEFFKDSEKRWPGVLTPEVPFVGPNDLKLAKKLIAGGTEHRKFLRQIQISFDITVPRYVWTEFDTYKVATVRNSCSTMHKLGSKDLEASDFQDGEVLSSTLKELNGAGRAFRNKTEFTTQGYIILKGYDIVRYMKKILPEGFLQKATFTMNYETALSMYFQRRNHRLPEWRADKPGSICSFIASLPYMKEFIEAKDV